MKEYISQKGSLLIFENNKIKELSVRGSYMKYMYIKLYAWLQRRNKSVSGDEVTTLSLFAAAKGREEEGDGRREQRVARNFLKTLKIKFSGGHQDVLRVSTALHLGSRKIGAKVQRRFERSMHNGSVLLRVDATAASVRIKVSAAFLPVPPFFISCAKKTPGCPIARRIPAE